MYKRQIYYPGKIHQITGNSIFVLIVLQFVQQHIPHIGFVVIRDQKMCIRDRVDAQEEAEITILEISYLGGFVKYDLHTKGGNVDVVRSYYK